MKKHLKLIIFLLPLAGLFLLLSKHSTEAAWWQGDGVNWGLRKQLTINNESSEDLAADTTITLTFDTKSLYDMGYLQDDCDDLRIVYVDGGNDHSEVTRYVEYPAGYTCSTSQATKVSFPLQATLSGSGSSTSYFLYYSNPHAEAPANVDDAFDIGDAQATLVCSFDGTTTCAAGETPSTESGAIRYSQKSSALNFDGVNDSIAAGNVGTGIKTIEFWVYPRSTSEYFIDLDGGSTYISASSGTVSATGVSDPTIYIDGVDTTTIAANKWQHVAVVTDTAINASNVTLGKVSTNYFDGLMDELRLSDMQRYTSGFTTSTSPLLPDEHTKLLLHFDENGDDPRNTGKALDASGNGNHGTITGAKYVSGIVGIDSSTSDTGTLVDQSYAGRGGIFLEEGTTNLVTNPSFENTTSYDTNWNAPNIFDYSSPSTSFTASMAKRNTGTGTSAPFAAGVVIQDRWTVAGGQDLLSYATGAQISSNFYENRDLDQGSVVFWITPEWNGNDNTRHDIYEPNPGIFIGKTNTNALILYRDTTAMVSTDISDWTAGTTYLVTVRWDRDNTLDGTNYAAISINDSHSFGHTSAIGTASATPSYIGDLSGHGTADALIEGLTIYRRPLFDGETGIDVGNGDEIEQIFNSGAGQDPTLITGSWDVVFALPTNANTGALATGEGEAWSHPHSSNLLVGGTVPAASGFMMNGTHTLDGWNTITSSDTLTLNPDADVELYYPLPNNNTGNNPYFAAGLLWDSYKYNVKPTLMKFDFSGLPAGATINSATLYLYKYNDASTWSDRILYWNRILPDNSAWTEAQATWNYANTGSSTRWTGDTGSDGGEDAGCNQSGVDFDTTEMLAHTIPANSDTTGTEYEMPIDSISEFTEMVDSNYGGILYGLGRDFILSSSEHTTAEYRPKLVVGYEVPGATVSALDTSEKIFAGGYKWTNTAADQGIYQDISVTAGDDWVVRALAHSDGTSIPKIILYDQTNGAEIGSMTGTVGSGRTDPDVFIFTGEAPAGCETLRVKLVNTESSGTVYWHQVEVLPNLISNPSLDTGSSATGTWIPTGWSNSGLDANESFMETSDKHSGAASFKIDNTANPGGEGIEQGQSITDGKYYGMGFWGKETTDYIRVSHGNDFLYNATGEQVSFLNLNSTSWKHYPYVSRVSTGDGTTTFLLQTSSAGGLGYFDDYYRVLLDDVTLTVTPASQANSTESTGLRVDGTDTLTQDIDTITTSQGTIEFDITPRHSFAVADIFGSTAPAIADIYIDANDYIKVYRSDDSTIRVAGSFNGTAVNADWASPTLNAGTTYKVKIDYNSAGNLNLYIDNDLKASAAMGSAAFDADPTTGTAYFGSDHSGANQYDLTMASPRASFSVSENTTAPYYKFGSASSLLDNSGGSSNEMFNTLIDPNSTSTHTLSAYVYDGTTGNVGGTVSNTVAQLVFEGDAKSDTTYTDMGGGWWRLSYAAATTDETNEYGIYVLGGKKVYSDGLQLEAKAYMTSYADGGLGSEYSWSGTANESTSTRTVVDLRYTLDGELNPAGGAISLWWKPNYDSSSVTNSATRKSILSTNVVRNGGSQYLALYYNENKAIFLHTFDSSGFAQKAIDFSAGDLIHIVATWDGSNANVYVNNSAGTGYAYSQNMTPTTLYLQGATGAALERPANALLSDIKFYDSELSSAQITDLYYAGLVAHSEEPTVERFTESKGQRPIAVWKLDEANGTTAYDSSIQGNNLTLETGSSAPSWETHSCVSGNCLKFDGSDDYLAKTNDTAFDMNTDSFTLAGWFRHSSTISGTDTIISKYGTSGYKVYMDSSGYVCFGIDDDSTWGPDDPACTTVSYADSKWHHFEAVKDGTSSITLYIDGESAATDADTSADSSLSPNGTFYVGGELGANTWDGFLDELKVYPYARSADQIKTDLAARGMVASASATFADQPSWMSEGLVGYWKMDEASWSGEAGEVIDSSGNGNHGVAIGTTVPTTGVGKFGSGAVFSTATFETDKKLQLSNADSIDFDANTEEYTVSIWVKSEAPGSPVRCINKSAGDAQYPVDFICSTTSVEARFTDGTNTPTVTFSDGTIWDGSWHLLTFVVDNTKRELYGYLDGTLVDSETNTVTQTTDNNSDWYIGNTTQNNRAFNGSLDELRVYKRALSAEEVKSLYEWAPGPVMHLKFDEGTGSTAKDSSGNDNTGTLGTGDSAPRWTNGKYGKALEFDGTSDYVDVGDGPAVVNTVEFWAKPASDTEYFLDLDGSSYIWVNSGTVTGTGISSPTIYIDGIATATIATDNNWHHIAVTTTNSIDAGDLDVGRVEGSGYFEGLIDDVRVYDYVRSQKLVVSDMNAGHPSVGSPVGSPIAYYKFNEGYGSTAYDSYSHGYHVTLDAGGTAPSWTLNGKFGKALSFDGSDDRASVTIPDFIDQGDGTFTISAWVKRTNGLNSSDLVIGKAGYHAGLRGISGVTDSIRCALVNTDNTAYTVDSPTLTLNQWYHMVCMYDETTNKISLYVDGKKVDDADFSGTIFNYTDVVYFGNTSTISQSAPVDLDEVKLYKITLTDEEIKSEYNQGKASVMGAISTESSAGAKDQNAATRKYCIPGDTSPCTAPVAEWLFEEGQGGYAYDTSNNENTGTLLGTSTWKQGKTGKALWQDGNGDGMTISNPGITGAYTVSYWEKIDNSLSYAWNSHWLQWTWENYGFIITHYTCTSLYQQHENSTGGTNNGYTTPNVCDNKWHHYTITYNGADSGSMYLDGKLIKTESISPFGIDTSGGTNQIATYGSLGNSSAFDTFRIYNYERTPAQIAWEYNQGAPIAQYKLNECTGTTAGNSARNANGEALGLHGSISIGDSGANTSVGTCTTTDTAWYNGVTGKFGASLDLDGTDDYVDVGDTSRTDIKAVSFWVKPDSTTQKLLELSASDSIEISSGTVTVTGFGTETIYVDGKAGATISDTEWHMITVVSSSDITANDVNFGKVGSDYFAGQMDEVNIYNYGLTSEQVKILYNQGSAVRF